MPIKFYLKGALKKERFMSLKKENSKAAKEYLKKPLPLILSVSHRGDRVLVPVGISIPPCCWDGHKIKDVIEAGELTNYNKYINDSENNVRDYLKSNPRINKNDLMKLVRNENKKDKNESNDSELDFIKLFDTILPNMTNKKGFPLSIETKKKFKSTINHLTAFVSEKHKSRLLKDLNQTYFDEFKESLYEKGLNDNTVPKYLKAFNSLLNDVVKKGYPTNIKSFEYYSPEYEPPVFIVELHEIIHLINFEFQNLYLERVRDLFIFMCFTGQRISDSKRIGWLNITTTNSIPIWINTTKKTSETIHVPIPDFAMDVLRKYADSGNPIPVMSDQYFNRSLKIMAEVAGLKRMILQKNVIKNVVNEEMVPLYTKISSHIARKSFITNALILGMSEREVKTVSGHKDDKSFRRYVQLAEHVQKKARITLSRENIENYLRENKQLSDC